MESNGSYFLNQRTLKHVIQKKSQEAEIFFFRPVFLVTNVITLCKWIEFLSIFTYG